MTPVGEILMTLMEREVKSETSLSQLLCEDACRTLAVMGVGISLMDADGPAGHAASSDPVTAGIEAMQLSLGEGPALDAFHSGRLVLVPDLASVESGRWPAYTPAVLALDVRGVMAHPLRIGGIRLGVLSVYRADPGILEDDGLAQALQYVDAAVLVLLHLQSLDDDRGLAETARARVNGRGAGMDSSIEIAFPGQPEVHQATGMVSVQAQLSLKDALLLLQARAYADGVPIAEVARAVVDRTLSFSQRT